MIRIIMRMRDAKVIVLVSSTSTDFVHSPIRRLGYGPDIISGLLFADGFVGVSDSKEIYRSL